MTGDQLKFYTKAFQINGTTNLIFGDFIDPDNIIVEIDSVIGDKGTKSSEILNLKNNTLTDKDGFHRPFFFMTPVPLPLIVKHFASDQKKFNGFDRKVFVNHYENGTVYGGSVIDKETGIILNFNATNDTDLFGKPIVMNIGYKLIDTNIIESSIIGKSIQPDKNSQDKIIEFKDSSDQPLTANASSKGGGCLIATAAYGTEMVPQVQFLREIRDNKLMNTQSGTSFMTGFNQFYYSFSPYVADYERENPIFKELVKIGITPMLLSLSILSEADSEQEVLGLGVGIILLNVGIYFITPAMIVLGVRKLV